MLFDKVIAFDNFRQKIILIVNMKTGALEQEYYKAQLELEKLVNLIRNGKPAPEQSLKLISNRLFPKKPTARWWKRENVTSGREISSR